ncbi:hypothetical protein AAC387_Pa08g0294 [Persea americana]
MGGNLSKRTPNQNLAHGGSGEDGTFAIDLTHPNFRLAFQSLSFNTLIEFTNSPLEMDDKAANSLIDSKSRSWRDEIFSQTLKDYVKVTSEMLKSLSSSPTTNEAEEEDHQLENLLKYFNEKCKSLEQQLQTHKSKINPKMNTYRKLQVAAKMLVMVPFIAPITGTLLVGEKLHAAAAAAVASFAFVAFGAAGRWASFFCERRKEELKVKEEVISLMLMSIAFQKNSLNGISDGRLVQDAVDEYLSQVRKERKTILQKLSEYESPSGVTVTLEDLV